MTRQELADLLLVERFAPAPDSEAEVVPPDMYAWERLKTLMEAVSESAGQRRDSRAGSCDNESGPQGAQTPDGPDPLPDTAGRGWR